MNKLWRKLDLFIDADDTILKSSETVIDIINKQQSTEKTINDLRDWNYRSICGSITPREVNEVFNSLEFFSQVETNPAFDKFLENMGDKIRVHVVTKGTEDNLELKRQYFENKYDDFDFIGLKLVEGDEKNFDKSSVDMHKGVCIDDRIDCLRSCNAAVKILIRNYRNMPWANVEEGAGIDNLYIVNSWEEIEDIITFIRKFKFMLETFDD